VTAAVLLYAASLLAYQERWIRDHLHRGETDRAVELADKNGLPLPKVREVVPGDVPLLAALHMKLALDFRRASR
jgi:hypothetical protein